MSTPCRLLSRPSSLGSILNCACRRPIAPGSRSQYDVQATRHQAQAFSSSPVPWSGHSKWASIKHDKGKNDRAKSKQRAQLTKDISNAVKLAGPDPNMNPRLALAINIAKKAAVPKAGIEAAIARGQGLSATGAALEPVTFEARLPQGIAVIIECQSENKLGLLADLRSLVKKAGGQSTPITFAFEKKGRIIFKKKEGVTADDTLDAALEAGVLDVEDDAEGRIVMYTEPNQLITATKTLEKQLDMEIEESEVIWDPNEDTKAPLEDETATLHLDYFLNNLQDVIGVQGIYLNWTQGSVPDDMWAEMRSKATV